MDEWRARLQWLGTALRCTRAEALALTVLIAGALVGLALVWLLARAGPAGQGLADSLWPGGDGSPGSADAADASDGDPASADEPFVEDGPAVMVHVVGAVPSPGVVEVPAGSRIADAIEAAGGVEDGADLSGVNLARVVKDGEQVVVADGELSAEHTESNGDERVNLNRADAAELETVPGVGPVTAERIISHREQHGPFMSAEELLAVPGIGEATLEQLIDHVRW